MVELVKGQLDWHEIINDNFSEVMEIIEEGGLGLGGGSLDIPITLSSNSWVGDEAPYSQIVNVFQMREGMTPLYMLDMTTITSENVDALQYAYGLLTGYMSGYTHVTFQVADLPTVDIPLILKGIPAQRFETADNTVIFPVEPVAFALNADADNRYQATFTVEGMTEGDGGIWDIVRSGPVMSLAESKIAASITDVERLDGAVKITCLEVPAQRYLMKISGVDINAESGSIILSGMQEWFDRVEEAEDNIDGIVNPMVISFTPQANNDIFRQAVRNDSVLVFPIVHITQSTGTNVTITISGISRYVWGKIDDANPFNLTPQVIFSVPVWLYSHSGAGYAIQTIIEVSIFYDGVNTYLFTNQNYTFEAPITDLYMVPMVEGLFNMQSKQ